MKKSYTFYFYFAACIVGFFAGRATTEDAKLQRQLQEGHANYILSCTMGDLGEPQGECEARWNNALERGTKTP